MHYWYDIKKPVHDETTLLSYYGRLIQNTDAKQACELILAMAGELEGVFELRPAGKDEKSPPAKDWPIAHNKSAVDLLSELAWLSAQKGQPISGKAVDRIIRIARMDMRAKKRGRGRPRKVIPFPART